MLIQLVGKFQANETHVIYDLPEKLHLSDYQGQSKKRKLYDINNHRLSVSLIALTICENVTHDEHFPEQVKFNYSYWNENANKTKIRIPIIPSEGHHRRSTIFFRPQLDLSTSEEEEEEENVAQEEEEELEGRGRQKRDLTNNTFDVEVRFLQPTHISKIQNVNAKTIDNMFSKLKDYHTVKVNDHFSNLLSHQVTFSKNISENRQGQFTISVSIPPNFFFGFSNKVFWTMLGFTQTDSIGNEKLENNIKYFGIKTNSTEAFKLTGKLYFDSSMTIQTVKDLLSIANIDIPDDIYIFSENLKPKSTQSVTLNPLTVSCITDSAQYLDYITKGIKKAYRKLFLNAAYLPQMKKFENGNTLMFTGSKIKSRGQANLYNFEIEFSTSTIALAQKIGLAADRVIWRPLLNEWRSETLLERAITELSAPNECQIIVPTEPMDVDDSVTTDQSGMSSTERIFIDVKKKITDALLDVSVVAPTKNKLLKLRDQVNELLTNKSMEITFLTELVQLEQRLNTSIQALPDVLDSDDEDDTRHDDHNENTLRIALSTAKRKLKTLQKAVKSCNQDSILALEEKDKRRREELRTAELKRLEDIRLLEVEHKDVVEEIKKDHTQSMRTIENENTQILIDIEALKKQIRLLETSKKNLTEEVRILTDKVNADAKTIDQLKKDVKAKNLEILGIQSSIQTLKREHATALEKSASTAKTEKDLLLADVSSLQSKVDALEKTKKQLEEDAQTLNDQLSDNDTTIKEVRKTLLEKENEILTLTTDINALKNTHKTALSTAKTTSQSEITAKENECTLKLGEAEKEYNRKLNALKATHKKALNQKQLDVADEIKQLKDQLKEAKKDTSTADLLLLNEEHVKALNALRTEKNTQINELNLNAIAAATRISNLEKSLLEAVEDKKTNETKLIEEASEKTKGEKETLTTELTTQYNLEKKRITDEALKEKNALETRYKEKHDGIEAKYKEEKEKVEKGKLEITRLTNENGEKTDKITQLSSALNRKLVEYNELNDQLKTAQNRISQLSRRAVTPEQEEVEEEEEFTTPQRGGGEGGGGGGEGEQEYLDITIQQQQQQNISQRQYTNMLNIKRHHCKPSNSFPNFATILLREGYETDYIGEKGLCCILATITKNQASIHITPNESYLNNSDLTKLTLSFIDEHLNTFKPPNDLYTLATFNIE